MRWLRGCKMKAARLLISVVVVGLVLPGVSPQVAVAAPSAGPASLSGVTATACRPDSPVSAGCTPGDLGGERLRVTWALPSPSTAPFVQYIATAWSASTAGSALGSCSSTRVDQTNCTIEGLVNGTATWVDVVAVDTTGSSAPSSPRVTATPIDVPLTPIGLDAQPATSANQVISGAVNVTWQGLRSPDETGGSEIARYSVSVFADSSGGSPIGSGCSSVAGSTGPAATSCVVSGLPIGVTLWFTVTATSRVGLVSTAADRIPAAAAAAPPTAPQRVAAVEGPGQLRVSWGAPAGDATAAPGQRVTGYSAVLWDSMTGGSELGRCTTEAASAAVAPATICSVTGLTNGTTAYAEVIARNAAGDSAPSSPRVPGTPRSVPGPPADLIVTPGPASLRASWSAPSSNGGWPISAYTVTAYDAATGGATLARCVVALTSASTPLTCALSGLVNGSRAWLSVTAANQAGPSAPSIRVSGTPTLVVPDAPRSVTAQAADNRVQVNWAPPSVTGGSSVIGYTASAWSSAGLSASLLGSCSTEAIGSAAPATTCTIDGLLNGDPVWVMVRARNVVGLGAPSGPRVQVTPVAVPDAPPAPSVEAGLPGQLLVSWAPPGDDGGLPVVEYRLTVASSRTGGSTLASCTVPAATASCTVTGLVNEVSQWVSVQARNALGWGESSGRVEGIPQAALPGPPTGVAVTSSSSTLRVTWRAPLSNGGSPVIGYSVRAWTSGNGGTLVGACATPGSAQGCTVTGLVNGTTAFVDVVATTLAGDSTPSTPRVASTPRGVPQPPTGVVAQAAFSQGRVIPELSPLPGMHRVLTGAWRSRAIECRHSAAATAPSRRVPLASWSP